MSTGIELNQAFDQLVESHKDRPFRMWIVKFEDCFSDPTLVSARSIFEAFKIAKRFWAEDTINYRKSQKWYSPSDEKFDEKILKYAFDVDLLDDIAVSDEEDLSDLDKFFRQQIRADESLELYLVEKILVSDM